MDAHLRGRLFRVEVYEQLGDRESPLFSAHYEEKIQVLIDDEWRPLWVNADLPWEAGDSVEEVMRAALAHVDRA